MQLIETYTDLPVESRTAYRIIAENKLVQVEQYDSTPTLTSTSTYSYDGFGRRVKKSVDGSVTYYVYDMEDIRFETDELGNIIAEYTHGHRIDEPLAMRRNGANYYYHVNGLGSITALTDSSTDSPKTVVQSYVYDSFGQIISQTGTITNPYTFTGREYDPETGLYYYRARYYDAKMGRFISEDPIGVVPFGPDMGINHLYLYVTNNPVNYIDPMGLAGIGIEIPVIPDWLKDWVCSYVPILCCYIDRIECWDKLDLPCLPEDTAKCEADYLLCLAKVKK